MWCARMLQRWPARTMPAGVIAAIKMSLCAVAMCSIPSMALQAVLCKSQHMYTCVLTCLVHCSQARRRHRLHQDVALLPTSEEDALQAQLAMLAQHGSRAHSNWSEARKGVMAQPIFDSSAPAGSGKAAGGGQATGGSSKALVVAVSGKSSRAAAQGLGVLGGSSKKVGTQGLSAAGQKLLSNKLQSLAKQQKAQQGSVFGK